MYYEMAFLIVKGAMRGAQGRQPMACLSLWSMIRSFPWRGKAVEMIDFMI